MAELIFQEVLWEPKSTSICCITLFSILSNQVNVTDIVNKPSVGFFIIITTIAKKNSGVVLAHWSQREWMNESMNWADFLHTDVNSRTLRTTLIIPGWLR